MCIDNWDKFEMNISEGKADLDDSVEVEDEVFERAVPEGTEESAVKAAEACPVNAIRVFDDEQVRTE